MSLGDWTNLKGIWLFLYAWWTGILLIGVLGDWSNLGSTTLKPVNGYGNGSTDEVIVRGVQAILRGSSNMAKPGYSATLNAACHPFIRFGIR